MTEVERLRELLAKATPELTDGTASVKAVENLLRADYAGQRPRAKKEPLYVEDAELIVTAVNALPNLLNRIDALTAERDRIADVAATYADFWDTHHASIDAAGNYIPHSQIDGDLRAAEAECARLRVALREIAKDFDDFTPNPVRGWFDMAVEQRDIARAALEPKP